MRKRHSIQNTVIYVTYGMKAIAMPRQFRQQAQLSLPLDSIDNIELVVIDAVVCARYRATR